MRACRHPMACARVLIIPAAWTLFAMAARLDPDWLPLAFRGLCRTGWPTQGYAPLLRRVRSFRCNARAAGLLWVLVTKKKIRFLVLLLAVVGTGRRAHRRLEPRGRRPVSRALLQGNIEQKMKFRPERYARIPKPTRASPRRRATG